MPKNLLYSDGLLERLKQRFPDKTPKKGTSKEELDIQIGHQEVIKFAESLLAKEQQRN